MKALHSKVPIARPGPKAAAIDKHTVPSRPSRRFCAHSGLHLSVPRTVPPFLNVRNAVSCRLCCAVDLPFTCCASARMDAWGRRHSDVEQEHSVVRAACPVGHWVRVWVTGSQAGRRPSAPAY